MKPPVLMKTILNYFVVSLVSQLEKYILYVLMKEIVLKKGFHNGYRI